MITWKTTLVLSITIQQISPPVYFLTTEEETLISQKLRTIWIDQRKMIQKTFLSFLSDWIDKLVQSTQ